VQQRDDRAYGLVDDPLDQVERVLCALAQTDDGDVGLLKACELTDVLDPRSAA